MFFQGTYTRIGENHFKCLNNYNVFREIEYLPENYYIVN